MNTAPTHIILPNRAKPVPLRHAPHNGAVGHAPYYYQRNKFRSSLLRCPPMPLLPHQLQANNNFPPKNLHFPVPLRNRFLQRHVACGQPVATKPTFPYAAAYGCVERKLFDVPVVIYVPSSTRSSPSDTTNNKVEESHKQGRRQQQWYKRKQHNMGKEDHLSIVSPYRSPKSPSSLTVCSDVSGDKFAFMQDCTHSSPVFGASRRRHLQPITATANTTKVEVDGQLSSASIVRLFTDKKMETAETSSHTTAPQCYIHMLDEDTNKTENEEESNQQVWFRVSFDDDDQNDDFVEVSGSEILDFVSSMLEYDKTWVFHVKLQSIGAMPASELSSKDIVQNLQFALQWTTTITTTAGVNNTHPDGSRKPWQKDWKFGPSRHHHPASTN